MNPEYLADIVATEGEVDMRNRSLELSRRGRAIKLWITFKTYGIDKLRFVKPVFIGDTIHVKKTVLDTLSKGSAMGVVTFETTVLNQSDETVLVYRDKLAIKKRPE